MGEAIRADEVVSLQRASNLRATTTFCWRGRHSLGRSKQEKEEVFQLLLLLLLTRPARWTSGRVAERGPCRTSRTVRLRAIFASASPRPRRAALASPPRVPARLPPETSSSSPPLARGSASSRPPLAPSHPRPAGSVVQNRSVWRPSIITDVFWSVVNLIAALCVAPSPLSPPPRASDLARPALGRSSSAPPRAREPC